ncbi:FecR domain-containing protein [Limibacter armeniacum]|uniref:FecR family protein n=1 Tax=Limibacter armeniacum TaxID=466084 RepID=UPI002FE5EE82
MKIVQLKDLIEKYKNNQLNDEERDLLDRWYFAFDLKPDDDFLNQWKQGGREAAYHRIWSGVKRMLVDRKPVQRWWQRVPMQQVAVLVIMLSGLLGLVLKRDVLIQELEQAMIISVIAPKGQMLTYHLPDGSGVSLHPGSKLKHYRFFMGSTRTVKLEGEGFFEVTKNKDKPFVVQTGLMETRVLGTSFDVVAIPKSKRFVVTVKTGKVQVSYKDQLLAQLVPGTSIRVKLEEDGKPDAVREEVRDLRYLSWMEGKLSFEEISLQELVWYLKQRYGVEVHLGTTAIKELKLSGDFTGLSVVQVLKIIQEIYPLEVTQLSEEKFSLTERNSDPNRP